MLALVASVVGFTAVGGVLLFKARRPPVRPDAPPKPGDVRDDGEHESSTPKPKAPQDSTMKDVKDVLGHAKDVADLAGGGEDAVKAASKLTQEVVKATIAAEARTPEGKLVANVGGVAAAGVSAWAAYEVFLASTSIAGPVGLAIGTAAVVVLAIVVNLVDIAVTLDKQRQRPFIQGEIDKLVSQGKLRDAWAMTEEAKRRGIPVGWQTSQPMWGDAKQCVKWPPPDRPELGDGSGPRFLDAEEVIKAAYAKARAAFDADLRLSLKKNKDGSVTRPRTNRDKPDAMESKRIGEAWCRYIGGHIESGVCDDGKTVVNEWVGLTPWQPTEVLIRYYGPPLHDGSNDADHRVPGTAKGARDLKTKATAAGAGTTTTTQGTHVTTGSTSSGTGGSKQRETDL